MEAPSRPLDPRFVPLTRITGAIGALVASAVLLFTLVLVLLLTRAEALLWVLAGAGWLLTLATLVVVSQLWPSLAYRHISYRTDVSGIEIRRGVFWREVVTVPRSRIQHTDVVQGPLARPFGLATLVLHTAGTENASVRLSGLEHEEALSLRDRLVAAGSDDAL